MTGKHRKFIISFAILVLIALNAWRWWPSGSSSQSAGAGRTAGAFKMEDFVVKGIPADSLPPLTRDIFHQKMPKVVKQRVAAPSAKVAAVPVKSPEEIAIDSAQAEFAQIQCVGISVRNGLTHAYIISSGEALLVSNGDKVGSRFVVEKILSDSVSLRDPDTGVGGIISISGKK